MRHFRCAKEVYSRKTFAEPLPTFLLPHAQRTSRQRESLQVLGEVVGGEAGARVSKRLGMTCSEEMHMFKRFPSTLPYFPSLQLSEEPRNEC